MHTTKQDILAQLRKEVLLLQGFKPAAPGAVDTGLGPVAAAFPNGIFPTGAIHEFLSAGPETTAATGGFVSGIIATLMRAGGACLWISTGRKVFPPGLKAFGIEPDQVVFIDLKKETHVLWAVEEALKCEGVAAVVGESREIGFTASRRMQLAVEQSRVTGFVLRDQSRNLNPIACTARWKISPILSQVPVPGMPGIGHPRWTVELLKVKNAHPGIWQMEWAAGRFQALVPESPLLQVTAHRKTG